LRIKSLIDCRASRAKDKQVKAFVTAQADKRVRGSRIGAIKGVLNDFDPDCGDTFDNTAGHQARTSFDSIINDRHALAHQATCSETVRDVERFFHEASGVFAGIVAAFDLKAHEVKHLS
jgi:hypothetical protein